MIRLPVVGELQLCGYCVNDETLDETTSPIMKDDLDLRLEFCGAGRRTRKEIVAAVAVEILIPL